jgi:hypothetical protein
MYVEYRDIGIFLFEIEEDFFLLLAYVLVKIG